MFLVGLITFLGNFIAFGNVVALATLTLVFFNTSLTTLAVFFHNFYSLLFCW